MRIWYDNPCDYIYHQIPCFIFDGPEWLSSLPRLILESRIHCQNDRANRVANPSLIQINLPCQLLNIGLKPNFSYPCGFVTRRYSCRNPRGLFGYSHWWNKYRERSRCIIESVGSEAQVQMKAQHSPVHFACVFLHKSVCWSVYPVLWSPTVHQFEDEAGHVAEGARSAGSKCSTDLKCWFYQMQGAQLSLTRGGGRNAASSHRHAYCALIMSSSGRLGF